MNPLADKDNWHRPEYRDRLDEIESRSEYEERNKLKRNLLSTRFRDYADRVPQVVVDRWRSGTYPEQVYVTSELDAFLESIKGHDAPRTPEEVAAAEVARYERGVENAQKRVEARQADLDKAKRSLDNQQRRLKGAKQRLAIEQGG